jgi:hypothetical protein
MDPITISILTSLAVNYFSGYTQSAVNELFDAAFKLDPQLEPKLQAAGTSKQLQEVLSGVSGVLEANANTGSIAVDGALLEAIRRIHFDHQHGTVTIGNSTVSSAVVVTGGSTGATGQTIIGGNTFLKSQGTSIEVGRGASIKISGGANIKQT